VIKINLENLIDEAENLIKSEDSIGYNEQALEQKREKWISKSISFLKDNYSDSVLTTDFIKESEKLDKSYSTLLGILKGLKDVEDEIDIE
jgi:hypothetical protein